MARRSTQLASVMSLVVAAGCGELAPTCEPGEPVTETPLAPTAAGYLRAGHSHNDYERDRPLERALDAGLGSVEADVWLRGGVVHVAHDDDDRSRGTLQALYLDPLQARVDALGSVHGDGVAFHLWVDLKDGRAALHDELEELLAGYPMVTRFDGVGEVRGAVTVVLTGDGGSKRAYAERVPPWHAAVDRNDLAVTDEPAGAGPWRYYALDWDDHVDWDGRGAPSREARRRVACVVQRAHDRGRRVRFYATPETSGFRTLARDSGVDFIGTDRPDELAAFLARP